MVVKKLIIILYQSSTINSVFEEVSKKCIDIKFYTNKQRNTPKIHHVSKLCTGHSKKREKKLNFYASALCDVCECMYIYT